MAFSAQDDSQRIRELLADQVDDFGFRRAVEIVFYACVFAVFLGLVGWAATGTAEVFFPICGVCLCGAVAGVLFAMSLAADAKSDLKDWTGRLPVGMSQQERDEVRAELEEEWRASAAVQALSHRILF